MTRRTKAPRQERCTVVAVRPGEWAVRDNENNQLRGPYYSQALAEAECRAMNHARDERIKVVER